MHVYRLETQFELGISYDYLTVVQHTWSYYTKKNIIPNTKLLGIKKYTYTFSPSTQEAEASGSHEFEASLVRFHDSKGHTKKSCLKIQIYNNSNNNSNNELSTEL